MDLLFWCHLRFFNHIFFIELVAIIPGLFRCPAEAAFSLVRAVVVSAHKRVEIGLDLLDAPVGGLSECHSIKFFLDDRNPCLIHI